MAAELVGGAFLSAALQVAFEKLASSDAAHYFRSRKLEDNLLRKLHITLISMNRVLDDAEQRQYTNPDVKKWLHELKHAVYVADDLLDEIAIEATRLKIEAENQTATSKVRGFFTAVVNPFDKHIESGIQQLLGDLEFLANQKVALELKEGSGGGIDVRVGGEVSNRLPTTTIMADESRICGRDGEKEKIIGQLLDEDLSRNPLSVISIVGMGGLGKTTLAQLVYNDTRVVNQFHLRAWVCVSEQFDVVRITKTILSALGCSITGYEDLNQLQLKLKEKLQGNKFLLVLDDIWNEHRSNWEALQVPFFHGTLGSKVLVTTRSDKVASVVRSIKMHHISLLNEEDGWKLFVGHAFENKDPSMYTDLESIGKQIVEKCKGLPLAIRTLGGLLHDKFSKKDWEHILTDEMWQLPEGESNIMPSLRLSYHYLPSNLKRCFAFCSIFPKDYEIDKDSLIQMWMAEDLLQCHQGNRSMEELGNQILGELESRSFLQKSRYNILIMHDLINDLAKSVSRGFCLEIQGDRVQEILETTRYLSYIGSIEDNEKLLEPIYQCKQLRCFMPLKTLPFCKINDKDVDEILSRLRHLRILRLNIVTITKLSDSVGNLKHLRYLDLSKTKLEKLPDSICTICNLQILKLYGCSKLVKLPLDLGKLINLRYLDLSVTKFSKLPDKICKLHNLETLKLAGCKHLEELPPDLHNLAHLHHLNLRDTKIKKMPINISRLKHLQILNLFSVGKPNGANIKELGKLNDLQHDLKISQLENVNNPIDASEARLKDKKNLDELYLEWSRNEDSQNERSVLEALQPHTNLKKLHIINYGGTKFVDWINAAFLPNLATLELKGCKYCSCLPPLGQLPSLKKLEISGLGGINKIGSELYGDNRSSAPFSFLKTLMIDNMEEWEEWSCFEGECFPCLNWIVIRNCPKLRNTLPPHLPCLKNLNIEGCGELELISFPMEAFSAPKLEHIILSGLTQLKSLHEDMHTLFPSLLSLNLYNCPELQSVPQSRWPGSLYNVSIMDCPKLIASRMMWGLHKLHSLRWFYIGGDFENVESFPEEGLLPPNLEYLGFIRCSNLTKINGTSLLSLISLQRLAIDGCPNLQCLPEEGLPNSLSHLDIWSCPLLKQRCQKENGQDWHKISHIPSLKIDEC